MTDFFIHHLVRLDAFSAKGEGILLKISGGAFTPSGDLSGEDGHFDGLIFEKICHKPHPKIIIQQKVDFDPYFGIDIPRELYI